jgi:hypothetical protein
LSFLRNLVGWIILPYSLLLIIKEPGVSTGSRIKAVLFIILPALYVLDPFDLIPDITPLLGWIDDLVVIPLAAFLAKKLVPEVNIARIHKRSTDSTRHLIMYTIGVILLGLLIFAAMITASIYAAIRLLAS